MELLVASFIGTVLVSMALAAASSSRNLLRNDFTRTKINQTLRSGLDIIGADIRIGGENVPAAFPAFEVVNGMVGQPDQLVIRRNLVDRVLTLCDNATAGSSVTQLTFASGTGVLPSGSVSANCVFGDSAQASNLAEWSSFRTSSGTSPSAVKDAYIYDISTRLGQFIKYSGEGSTASSYFLTKTATPWTNNYNAGATIIMPIEEWRYTLANNSITLTINQDAVNVLNVVADISDFQISILMNDGTTKNSFTNADSWRSIKTIRISLSGQETTLGRLIQRQTSGEFFPRNVLSSR